jgi:hypothetical protein
MNRPLYSVAIVLLALLLPFMADDCSDLMDGVFPTAQSTDLTSSPDRTVQAAGQAEAVIKRRLQAYDAEQEALGAANLSLGEKMSFDKINKAIELNPTSPEGYFHKAAMQVAVGQDTRDSLGKALTASGPEAGVKDASDYYYTIKYRLALRDVSVKLPPGAARDRVNALLCPEVKDYKVHTPQGRDYEGVVCP